MKILDVKWFECLSILNPTVGIVVTENKSGIKKAFIGLAKKDDHENKSIDRIAKWGTPLPLGLLKNIVELLEDKNE